MKNSEVMLPKVSVIVPVYNTEQYLHKCLDSLVRQTLQDIEIILINDGATDSSPQILEEYYAKYPEKIIIFNQKNSGQAVARNRGVSACRGAYIAFLDSDDYMELTALEKLYQAVSKVNADMAYCDFYLDRGEELFRHNVKACKRQKELFIDCLVDPWNKIYRADVLKNHGVKFPEGYFYEDTGWFIETIPWIKKCVKVDEALIYHVERPGSTMTELNDKRISHIFPVLEEMLSYYREQNLYEKYHAELEYFYSKMLLCSSMLRISRVKDRKEEKKLVKTTFDTLKKTFPEYRKNKYYRGRKLGLYISLVSEWNAWIIITANRLKRYLMREEQHYGVCENKK